MINLSQAFSIIAAGIPGVVLILVSATRVSGWLLLIPLAVGLLIAYFLAWPIMQYLRTTPILARCPVCGKRFKPGRQIPLSDGLRIETKCCQTLVKIPGEWATLNDEKSFKPSKDFEIITLDEHNHPVKTYKPAIPKFYAVKWEEVTPT